LHPVIRIDSLCRKLATIPVGVEFCAASVTGTETLAMVTVPVHDEAALELATIKWRGKTVQPSPAGQRELEGDHALAGLISSGGAQPMAPWMFPIRHCRLGCLPPAQSRCHESPRPHVADSRCCSSATRPKPQSEHTGLDAVNFLRHASQTVGMRAWAFSILWQTYPRRSVEAYQLPVS
jgi:hypothetical protein